MTAIDDFLSIIKGGFKNIADFEKFDDYLDYKEIEEIYFNVCGMYDFEKRCFRFLPFNAGYLEQEDTNSKYWQIINYMIYKILEKRG